MATASVGEQCSVAGKSLCKSRNPIYEMNPREPPRHIGMKERSNGPRFLPISSKSGHILPPPIKLDHQLRSHAHLHKPALIAQRDKIPTPRKPLQHRLNRPKIQMIVMVMRDKDGITPRQVPNLARTRLHPARTNPLRRS